MLRQVQVQQAGRLSRRRAASIIASFVLSGQGGLREISLNGLLPQRRGPRQGHKPRQQGNAVCHPDQDRRSFAVAEATGTCGGGEVRYCRASPQYPRQWQRRKKHREHGFDRPGLCRDPLITAYEDLRGQCLDGDGGSRSGPGLALLLGRGMWEWVKACGHLLELVPQRPADRAHAEQPYPPASEQK